MFSVKKSVAIAMVGASVLACILVIRQGSESVSVRDYNNDAIPNNNRPARVLVEVGSRRTAHPLTVASTIGPISVEGSAWKNDLNLVHVVNTDFMLHQAELKHLGTARLDLFKTFTLPSMIRQTNQQFLWLVWTDAELEKSVLDEFLELVAPLRNVVVLGSRQVAETNFRTLYGHSQNSLTWLREVVLSGDAELVAEYYKASQSHLLLETSLDADDALSYKYIETVQAEAAYTVGQDLESDSERMETFCPEYHAEWRYYTPNHSTTDEGHLVQVHNERFCIGSGVSLAYHVNARAHRVLCNEHAVHPDCTRRSLADRGVCDLEPYGRELNEYYPPLDNSMCEKKYVTDGPINSRRLGPGEQPVCPDKSMVCRGLVDGKYEAMNFLEPANIPLNTPVWITCQPRYCQKHVLVFEAVRTYPPPGPRYTLDIKYKGTKALEASRPCDPYLTDCDYKVVRGFAEADVIGLGNELWVIWWGLENEVPFRGAPFGWSLFAVFFAWLKICVVPIYPRYTGRLCRRSLRLLPFEEESSAKKLDASVLLSRTPTAAGMKSVMPNTKDTTKDELMKDELNSLTGKGESLNSVVLATYGDIASDDAETWKSAQTNAWESVGSNFGIQHEDVVALRGRMEDNMENILLDALNGQCTPGHSCKESTKKALGKLLDKVRD